MLCLFKDNDTSPAVLHDSGRPDDETTGPYHASLSFKNDGRGVAYVARQYATYPYHMTRPFYLDKAWPQMATMYLANLSGGLVQHDRVSCRVHVGKDAAAHVTDAAAVKIHTMDEDKAVQRMFFSVEENGYLEYVAEPVILFPNASLELLSQITLGSDATAIYVESFLTHKPDPTLDSFKHLFTEFIVKRPDEKKLVIDRMDVQEGDRHLSIPGLLGNTFAVGMVYVLGPLTDSLSDELRNVIAGYENIYGGVSQLPNDSGICARVLAQDGNDLKNCLNSLWRQSRTVLKGHVPAARKK